MALSIGSLFNGMTGGVPNIVDNALGRPFELWTQQVQAENAAATRHRAYRGQLQYPNALPSADAIYSAYRRGLIGATSACQALLSSGIMPSQRLMRESRAPWLPRVIADMRIPAETQEFYGNLWANISYMGMQRPDAGTIAMLQAQGRLGSAAASELKFGLDASWHRYNYIAEGSYNAPDFDSLLQMRTLGRITEADFSLWAKRLSWFNEPALNLRKNISVLPTPTECWLAFWRGAMSGERLRRYGTALGYVSDEDWNAVAIATRQLPGPSDLVRFAVREVWDTATVERWGYDSEFPEPLRAWLKWYGQDWGEPVRLPSGVLLPAVPWPLAYWRAHWQVISPSQAYTAFRLLRPERIQRYRHLAPDVQPFTATDLRTALKVADYPPRVRDWLAAISAQPLDLRTISGLLQLGLRGRQFAVDQALDRGLVPEDAQAWADLKVTQADRWRRRHAIALEDSLIRQTYAASINSYRDGLTDRATTVQNLQAIGLSPAGAERATGLVDVEFIRSRAVELVRQLRKKYLSGEVSEAEIPLYFRQAGLTPEAAARHILRWRTMRTLERRSLATSQVTALVAQGALTPANGAQRLLNLGWLQGDAALLIQQAMLKLGVAQTRAAAREASVAKASLKERQAALLKAQAAIRRLASDTRRKTPLSVLRRWLALGIRKGEWIRQRMILSGYDTSEIDSYLAQWVLEEERSPHPESPGIEGREKLVRRQTSLGTIKRWWQNGVVTDRWSRQRLAALGYTPETIALTLREWSATLGKKPGPAATEPPTEQPGRPEPAGAPRPLHQEPRPLHQEPRPLGT